MNLVLWRNILQLEGNLFEQSKVGYTLSEGVGLAKHRLMIFYGE